MRKKLGLSVKRAGAKRGPSKEGYAIRVEADPTMKAIKRGTGYREGGRPRFAKRHRS